MAKLFVAVLAIFAAFLIVKIDADDDIDDGYDEEYDRPDNRVNDGYVKTLYGRVKLFNETVTWIEAFKKCLKDDAVLGVPYTRDQQIEWAKMLDTLPGGKPKKAWVGIENFFGKENARTSWGAMASDVYLPPGDFEEGGAYTSYFGPHLNPDTAGGIQFCFCLHDLPRSGYDDLDCVAKLGYFCFKPNCCLVGPRNRY